MTSKTIVVKDKEVRIITGAVEDFICLTDIAKWKNPDANAVIANWLRNRNVLEYLGLWAQLYNPDFKPLEFEGFKKEAGLHAFTLSLQNGFPQPKQSDLFANLDAMEEPTHIKTLHSISPTGFPLNLNCTLRTNISVSRPQNRRNWAGQCAASSQKSTTTSIPMPSSRT